MHFKKILLQLLIGLIDQFLSKLRVVNFRGLVLRLRINNSLFRFLLRPESSPNVRSNTFDSTNSSLLQIAKSSYAENKQREDLSRLNKLRQITSESVQRAFGNNDNDGDDDDERKRSSSSSSSSSSSTDNDSNNRQK
jgi:hypothetical protein